MKTLVLLIFLIGQSIMVQAQELVLNVDNIKTPQGQLIISLFSSSEDFLKNPVYKKYIAIDSDVPVKVTLTDVPKGDYALCVIHDQNKNGNIDTNFLKIPKEAYGFSHNPKSRFGPPQFDAVKFGFYNRMELTVLLN